MCTCMDNGFAASALRESDSQVWTEEDDENTSNAIENANAQFKVILEGSTADNHVTVVNCCCNRTNGLDDVISEKPEGFGRTLLEVAVPFLMAGFGCVFAGILLDIVQHWNVFQELSEIFILVPALLGLKGNLEMTLASRLSTQAHLGHLDSRSEQLKVISGNLALTQVQAVVVGFLASLLAITLGWLHENKFSLSEGLMICSSSVITASLASVLLGSMMVGVVVLSRRLRINPDNVAIPIGGALGDVTTLSLLAGTSALLHRILDIYDWLPAVVLSAVLCLTPVWWIIASNNKYTHGVLYNGWTPIIGAMILSSIGGLILDFAVSTYGGIAVYQPIVNGVGGNLVAIQASRLATALHRVSVPKVLPAGAVNGCPSLFSTYLGSGPSAKTARVLMLMVIPGHVIFIIAIQYLRHDGHGYTVITPPFVAIYLTATVIQVATLLFVANWLVHWLWKRGHDPDNFSIPLLTASGDLLGGALLALTFHLIHIIGGSSFEATTPITIAVTTSVATLRPELT